MQKLQKNGICRRIVEFRRSTTTKIEDMSAQSGIPVSTLKKYESGDRTPGSDALALLIPLGVDANWLLTGEGNMYRDGRDAVPTQTDDLVQIPEYDVQLAAGSGSYPDDHVLAIKSRAFTKQWLLNKGLQVDKLVLARVMGQSMEPMLQDKDLVLIDRSRTTPSDAMPCAIRLDNVLYIKMARKIGDTLTLSSINRLYTDIHIDNTHDCEIIGAVVWHAHSWV